jgi:hypothetical protein
MNHIEVSPRSIQNPGEYRHLSGGFVRLPRQLSAIFRAGRRQPSVQFLARQCQFFQPNGIQLSQRTGRLRHKLL